MYRLGTAAVRGVARGRVCESVRVPRYVTYCRVRWSDTDAFGHVNNARYLSLFEEARTELVASAVETSDELTGLMSVVVARHEIDYLKQVNYGPKPVRIEVWVELVRNASFTVAYELFDQVDADGGSDAVGSGVAGTGVAGTGVAGTVDAAVKPAARARTLLVPYDLDANRIRRLAPAEKEFLLKWQIDPPAGKKSRWP